MVPTSKLSALRSHAEAGEWNKAISIAAKFPRLGEHRGAILSAEMAIKNPSFARQLKRDPALLIELGKSALIFH